MRLVVEVIATRAPAAASALAQAIPIPLWLPAPVTNATRPCTPLIGSPLLAPCTPEYHSRAHHQE